MEKSGRDENIREKKSRKRIDMTKSMEEEKRSKWAKSNGRKEMFWLWRFWAYHL